MSLTLRQVRYFVATAEIGQISQAALHLNISQSAVTTAIKELEGLLGVQLFQRSAQGMSLTDAGRHFLNRAYVILRSVDDALNSPLPAARAAGTLRLAASYTVIGYFLPHHLQRLAQWHPQIDIHVFEQEREAIERGLLEGHFDMAVVLTANLTHPDIVSETLFNSERRLWLPAHHRLYERPAVSLADIAAEPYILLTVDEAAQTAMRYWNQAGQQPNVRVRTSSVEAVRSMVANGSGVAILSDLVHRPWSLEGKRIETMTVSDGVPPMSVGLAWHREREPSPAMQALRHYFRDVLQSAASVGPRR
ncbi:LysR family transcriptional regulator [Pseudomonas sp. DTU_2021_1001937_2_SI_NGA_ILE_001]|uniref:LysR family transcriptional regulator n=1 Tax=Pseudomonas sp. DTU_2021_1001937_2_SI_NGA_ILE_001 TaxID=3077589 RepID=UPI0025D64BCA|nr:LysR family transcriptional regulator [Pseudomonas sp. DTU_2021_1001937_2_SI_NGA_ILE_001]WNW09602.1 LysR family transcriptional regulator [Pseudomonas sp. DTU_2021_1001937_2_SI_NGA_ILE_001]